MPPGLINMGFPLIPINNKALTPLTVFGVIFQHKPKIVKVCKISGYTVVGHYPNDMALITKLKCYSRL